MLIIITTFSIVRCSVSIASLHLADSWLLAQPGFNIASERRWSCFHVRVMNYPGFFRTILVSALKVLHPSHFLSPEPLGWLMTQHPFLLVDSTMNYKVLVWQKHGFWHQIDPSSNAGKCYITSKLCHLREVTHDFKIQKTFTSYDL